MNDFKFACRQLLKTPGFTAVAVLTLALGIGTSTAMFSVVNGILFKPLPYRKADRLVTVLHKDSGPVAPADFLDWREQNQSFELMAAAEGWWPIMTGGEHAAQVRGLRLTDDMFSLLGVQPLLGRTYDADDFRGEVNSLVISHSIWQGRFGGDPNIIGQTLTLDQQTYVVIGVMPQEFRFAPFWIADAEIFGPMQFGDRLHRRTGNSLRVFARLKDEVAVADAQVDMSVIARRLAEAYPDTNKDRTAYVTPLNTQVSGNVRPALLLMLGATALVLLIACANIAILLLARAGSRAKEMAVRAALGASRARTIQQMLIESLTLAALGGLLGITMAFWGVEAVTALLDRYSGSRFHLPRMEAVSMDWQSLAFALVAVVASGVIFGLAPAWTAWRNDLNQALKASGRRAADDRGSNRVRQGLVVGQIAVSMVLLVGAGLLMRSFLRLNALNPGFDPSNLVTMVVSVAATEQYTGEARLRLYRDLIDQIDSLPGVQSASAINHLPLAGDFWQVSIVKEGDTATSPAELPLAVYRVCLPRYFQTMGASLRAGRDFSERDNLTSPGVVVINESMARRQWPNEDPIGKRLALHHPARDPKWLTVVGVVNDMKQWQWAETALDEVFVPYAQQEDYLHGSGWGTAYLTLIARSEGDPTTLASTAEQLIWKYDRNLPISSTQTLEQVIAEAIFRPRMNVLLSGSFAVIAVLLAAIGLYGVMAYVVSNRTHDIGIRMSLGASRSAVVRHFLGQGLKTTLVGLALGMVGAMGITSFLSAQLFDIRPLDPATFAAVAGILALTSMAACVGPCWRATRVNPIEVLRHE